MGEFCKAVQGSLLRINQIVLKKMYFQGGDLGSCLFCKKTKFLNKVEDNLKDASFY